MDVSRSRCRPALGDRSHGVPIMYWYLYMWPKAEAGGAPRLTSATAHRGLMRRISLTLLPAFVALAIPGYAFAQTPDGVMLVFERFADVYGSRLVAAFDSIPAARYDYRPTPAQQSVGYIAQHLEQANYGLCERFSDLKHPRTAADSLADTVKARWPKDTLVARLRASLRFCDDALDRAAGLRSPATANSLLGFETDLAEHYSQLAVYMRLLGLVPPSALLPRPRVAVTLEGESLLARASTGGGAVRLWPEAPSEFFVKEAEAQVTFTRNATGAVTGLVLHQYGRDRAGAKIQ